MTEILISIPGPVFIFIFIIYSTSLIILAKRFSKKDYTYYLETPEPTKFSPLDLSILKNGIKGAIVYSIFNLWIKKAIGISKDKRKIRIHQKTQKINGFSDLENAIHKFVLRSKYYRQFFYRKSQKSINGLIDSNKNTLMENKLLADKKVITHHWIVFFITITLILTLGGLKLYYGINRDKPYQILLVLLIASVIVSIFVLRPHKVKISNLGIRLLDVAEKRFEWVKSSENVESILKNNSILYGVAVFGISSFKDIEGANLDTPSVLENRRRGGLTSNFGYGCAGCGGGCGASCGGGGCSSGCSGGCSGGCGGCGS